MGPLNDLITSAQVLLDSGFDVDAFHTWRELAYLCLMGLLGPTHYYTKSFAQFTRRPDEKGLLAGGGLLAAAQEHIVRSGAPAEDVNTVVPRLHGRFMSWVLRRKKVAPVRDAE